MGVQGSPCRGYGGVPLFITKGGAGITLPGVWGCPPSLSPKGCRDHPAGGMGVSPIPLSFLAPPLPYQGRGGWGVRGSHSPILTSQNRLVPSRQNQKELTHEPNNR